MRLIGQLKDEKQAKTFGDYLAGLEIKNLTEAETDGTWSVWIYSEDQIDKSRELLTAFNASPNDPKFKQFAGKAAELQAKEEKEQTNWEKRVKTKNSLWSNSRYGPLTLLLIGVCVIVAIYSKMGNDLVNIYGLFISKYNNLGLPEVQAGQVWRLITPIFIHFSFIHILFNMLWLKDLGSAIELRQGSLRFGLMVLLMAVVPNLCQYWVSGPSFGGMSGVVYGLLGYIWIRGKFDPFSGYHLDQNTVTYMLIWLVVCLVIPWFHVANTVHFVGLAIGAALGYWPVLMRNLSK